MTKSDQPDVLIVSDTPYSSGSNHSEEEQILQEEEEKEELIEEAKENKKVKKPSEPIFVSVITGTATLESNLIYSDKNQTDNISENEKGKESSRDVKNDRSKCCLLI